MKEGKRFYLCCGSIMLVSEIWKQCALTFLLNHGSYNWWYFPFQLCSVPMYLCLLIGLLPDCHFSLICKVFLADFSLLSGMFAFCDTSGMYYGYYPLTIHSFSWHILMIFIAFYAGLQIKEELNWALFFQGSSLYLVCCLIATLLNVLFHPLGIINMFYISPFYWMAQKVFSTIAHATNNLFGIGLYIVCTILGAALFHALWLQIKKRLQ